MRKHKASNHSLRAALVSLALAAVGANVLAANPPASPPANPPNTVAKPPAAAAKSSAPVSKETREKMAALHEQMAACLRSDKAIAACRDEMRKSCQQTMGDQGCSMMGGGMHHGMGMGGPPASDGTRK
jgi:hypothetical protein